MKFLLPFLITVLFCGIPLGKLQAQTYSIHQLDSLQAIGDKPIVLFISAEWCTYCEAMKNSTLQDEEVNDLLESRFYFIPFDGEQKEAVAVKGQTFNYIPNGKKNGVHELANQLGTIDGKLIYPVTTILNPKGEISFQYSGYLSKKAFMAVLKEAQ